MWRVFVGDWGDDGQPGDWTSSDRVFGSYTEARDALVGQLTAFVGFECSGCAAEAERGLAFLAAGGESGWQGQIDGDMYVLAVYDPVMN